jgi:hypothetical protein
LVITTASSTLDALRAAVAGDSCWDDYVERIGSAGPEGVALHLAVLVQPYLQRILEGRKTVESRFSARRVLPYERIDPGDVLLLKRSGGPIVGLARVARAQFLRVTPAVLEEVRARHAEALGVTDPAFWAARARASYATLLHLDHVRQVSPIAFTKRDQRAWVILCGRSEQVSAPDML